MSRVLAVMVLTASVLAAEPPQLVQRDAYLMGTRVSLATYAVDRRDGLATLDTALDVLERAERQLSTWRADSAVSRFNRAALGSPWHAEDGLCELFAEVMAWQAATNGTFDPAVGALADAWKTHESGAVPSDAQIEQARARTGMRHVSLDGDKCLVTRLADVTFDVGAFGKGAALDRAAAALAGSAWMIDLGGQVAVGGAPPDGQPWAVAVAHPLHRERPFLRVTLASGSLSTSGGSERDLRVGDTRVGHILDPRTGRPAPFGGSVVVWHERALVADILSTALYVMGPGDGLRWAAARGFAAAYLIPEQGAVRVAATPEFTGRLQPVATP